MEVRWRKLVDSVGKRGGACARVHSACNIGVRPRALSRPITSTPILRFSPFDKISTVLILIQSCASIPLKEHFNHTKETAIPLPCHLGTYPLHFTQVLLSFNQPIEIELKEIEPILKNFPSKFINLPFDHLIFKCYKMTIKLFEYFDLSYSKVFIQDT